MSEKIHFHLMIDRMTVLLTASGKMWVNLKDQSFISLANLFHIPFIATQCHLIWKMSPHNLSWLGRFEY